MLAAFCWAVIVSPASPQTNNPFAKSSSGLTLAVLKSDAASNAITLQFSLINNTQARVYVKDVVSDDAQKAFLGSGPQTQTPQAVGIENCQGFSLDACISPSHSTDLNSFSYIEPNDSIAFSFIYNGVNPVSDTDTISFSVKLIVRATKPNGDPNEAGPSKIVRFSFAYMPLNRR